MNDDKSLLKGPQLLQSFEDNWETEMGACILGKERVVLRGRDLLNEFPNHTWMELMVFATTGKEQKTLARLVEGIWVISTSFPDPRLWPNRVAALGGTTRTTGALAVTAGLAISEATSYGLRTSKGAFNLLVRFKKSIDAGADLGSLIKRELKKHRALWGFGRPLVSKDERIAPLLKFAKSLGYGNGPYVKLAFDIEEYLSTTRYGLQMNISALAAALGADIGISEDEFYYLASQSFIAGMVPCYIDSRNHPQGALFPLRTNRIDYAGHSLREWPN